MSPAKRLSRQRFRALCERCAKWMRGTANPATRIRVCRYDGEMYRTYGRKGWRVVDALARLAR